jgi:hypothetical protein
VSSYAWATAEAKASESPDPTNSCSAESISAFQALSATTPWASEPTIVVPSSVQSANGVYR